ncbi:TldD/PmbA family protein [Insolitispirillum peregrinum]|uniref:TldD/PmbA family protein n=1 Tax=Insolitispirillum peregrinum TaxID=80876 RepID=UPI003610F3F6
MSDTLSLLDDLITAARKAGADAADALLLEGCSISVGCRLGKLETLESSEGGDIGLRVLIGTRTAIVSSADRSKAALAELVERAVAMARLVPEDPYAGLADPEQIFRGPYPEIDQFDPTEQTAEQLIAAATLAEQAAMSVKGVTNSEGAEAGWGHYTVSLVASNGFSCCYPSSGSSLSVAVLAGDAEQGMERDYDYTSAVYVGDLRTPEDVGRSAGGRAVRRVGAQRAKTCKVPVIFDNRVARGVVGHLLGAISGPSVARGTTFLKDSLGQQIFAPNISIIEDPHRARGARSKPVDAEGLATVRRKLIDQGVLTTWLLDLRSARQLGMTPTGHAARGTSSQPSPSPGNVWLEAGERSVVDMIGEIEQGFYVTEVFGQGVNGVTGDYSRGASGFWIEDGELTVPVNEMTIASNLKDMFLSLEAASDLDIQHGTDAPSVRVAAMTVAGA